MIQERTAVKYLKMALKARKTDILLKCLEGYLTIEDFTFIRSDILDIAALESMAAYRSKLYDLLEFLQHKKKVWLFYNSQDINKYPNKKFNARFCLLRNGELHLKIFNSLGGD
jgi:hypothetical protein